MPKPISLRLVIAIVVIPIVAGVGYAGLTIWREGAPVETEEAPTKESSVTESPPLEESPSSESELDASGWKLYEGFGFEMKYPPQIEPLRCTNVGCNTLATELPNGTMLQILPGLDARGYEKYGEVITDAQSFVQAVARYTTALGVIEGTPFRTNVDGVEGIRIVTSTPIEGLLLLFPPIHQEVVFLYKDHQHIYIISHYAKEADEKFERDNLIFHKILSTIRFLEK